MSDTNQNDNKTESKNEKGISEFSDIQEDNYVYNSTSNETSSLSRAFWIGVVALCLMTVFAGFMTVTQILLRNNNEENVVGEENEYEGFVEEEVGPSGEIITPSGEIININEDEEETSCEDEDTEENPRFYGEDLKKPVIYIYNSNSNVEVSLDVNNGNIYCEYPKHTSIVDNTYIWNVRVTEDGTIYTEDNDEYSYIFWEALGNTEEYNFDDGVGYCVKGENTEDFLRDTLSNIGLTPKEYNEFIVYWLPLMQNNEYNLIKFYGLDKNDIYNKDYALTVKEDNNIINNQLRVFMIWKSSDSEITLEPQNFTNVEFDRYNGTAIVEWGGTEIH